MVLKADNGVVQVNRALTAAEMSRLSLALNSDTQSDEAKRTKVTSLVMGIVATQQAAQNFERGMEAEYSQNQIQRR